MSVKQISTIEDLLFDIQEYTDDNGVHFPQITHLLPADGQEVYNIDLDTRTVDAPEILSVQFDHNAEIVYFRCPRYHDNMDLASTVCLIQYKNAPHVNEFGKTVQDAGFYWVPYYDIFQYEDDPENPGNLIPTMLIPWAIGGLATNYAGTVTYSIRFYKMAQDGETYIYSLATRPKTGEVLHGFDYTLDELGVFESAQSDVVYKNYSDLKLAMEESTTYWVKV